MKRPSKKQMEAFILVHPEFEALGFKEAAKKLGITLNAFQQRLRYMKKFAPMEFDKLSRAKTDGDIYFWYKTDRGGPHFCTYTPKYHDSMTKRKF